VSKEQRLKAIALKMHGLTYKAIGEELGVSHQYAQQLVRPPKAIYDHVRRRADFKCQKCGIVTHSGHVHHVGELDHGYNDVENLKYLCASCHRAEHVKARPSIPQAASVARVPQAKSEYGMTHCWKCGHEWQARVDKPLCCPACKSYDYAEKDSAEEAK
jgi:Zn finger protein HypA/HybF involved in hydrogenase expression